MALLIEIGVREFGLSMLFFVGMSLVGEAITVE